MKLWKLRVPKESAPWADVPWPPLAFLLIRALAWTDRKGCVFYVRPGRRRFAHEAAHNLRQEDNGMHHPWWHFCVLVGHALRLHDGCATSRELEAGERLLAAADGEAVDA